MGDGNRGGGEWKGLFPRSSPVPHGMPFRSTVQAFWEMLT